MPLSIIIRDKPEDYGYVPDGVKPNEKATKEREDAESIQLEFRDAVRERTFWYVNITEVIRLMALATVVTHIMPYLSNVGLSRTAAGFVAAGIPFFSIAGRFGFGWLGDLVEKKYVMAIAYGLMGIGMLSLSLAEIRGSIYVFLFFFSNGFGGLAVLRSAILREYYQTMQAEEDRNEKISFVVGNHYCGCCLPDCGSGFGRQCKDYRFGHS